MGSNLRPPVLTKPLLQHSSSPVMVGNLFFFFLLLFFFSAYVSPFLSHSAAAPPSDLLSSPQFFLSSHARMLSSFKVFIYPPSSSPPGPPLKPPWLLHSQDDVSLFFYSLLSESSFVTHDPESAHLYFVPPYLPSPSPSSSLNSSPYRRKSARDMVQKLRDEYPFWQRTLGRDHFYAVCPRFSEDGSRNVLELQKNAIAMACSELFCNLDGDGSTQFNPKEEGIDPQFFPHKDIVLPPFHKQKILRKGEAMAEEDDLLSRPRPYLVYVMDSMNAVARELWCHDPEFLFHPRKPISETDQSRLGSVLCASETGQATSEAIASSKFCLTFASQGLMKVKNNSIDLVDAMVAGCVPVIISHGYLHSLPFQDLLDWTKFSVIVSVSCSWCSSLEKDLGKVKDYLKSMPEKRYRELQRSAISASKTHLQWHVPPRPYDAFHMLMHQLWLRSHSVRYIRRVIGRS